MLFCLLLFQKFRVYDHLRLCECDDRQFSLNHLINVSEKQIFINLIFVKLFVELLISFPVRKVLVASGLSQHTVNLSAIIVHIEIWSTF